MNKRVYQQPMCWTIHVEIAKIVAASGNEVRGVNTNAVGLEYGGEGSGRPARVRDRGAWDEWE